MEASDTSLDDGASSLSGFLSAMGSGSSSPIGTRTSSKSPSFSRLPSHPSVSSRASEQTLLAETPERQHRCLLDVMQVAFDDIDLFSAEWISKQAYRATDSKTDFVFPSYVVQRQVCDLYALYDHALKKFPHF